MISRLEDIFLRHSKGKARLREVLLACLDDSSLRTLRLVSRILLDLMRQSSERIFRQLFVHGSWDEQADYNALKAIAPFCRVLAVKIGDKESASLDGRPQRVLQKQRPTDQPRSVNQRSVTARKRWRHVRSALAVSKLDSSSSNATVLNGRNSTRPQSAAVSKRAASSRSSRALSGPIWTTLFSHCQQLQTIVISAHGEPGWPGRTHIEDELVDFRVALESASLPNVHCVCFTPIHAMGVVHLRWSGFGALDTVSTRSDNLWSNLRTLDVQLRNPLFARRKLSEWQQVMFRKILYDYLLSFAATLKRLRFVWLDEEGPSPITLDLEPGLKGYRQAILWTALEEVFLGNITLPHRTIRLLPERVANGSIRLKTLRSTHRHSRAVFEYENAWVEVLLDFAPHGIEREKVFSQVSSIYSQ